MKADKYVLNSVSEWIKSAEETFQASEVEQQLDDAKGRAEQAEAELVAFRDSEAISIIGQDAFLAGLRVRQETLAGVQKELARLSQTVSAAAVPELTQGAFSNFLELPQEKQREMLVMVLESVTVTRAENPNSKFADPADRVELHWKDLL